MKRYRTTLNDRIFPHHTEKDVFRIKLIFGKDHSHLKVKEGYLSRGFISKDRNELIEFLIELLNKYKKNKCLADNVYNKTFRRFEMNKKELKQIDKLKSKLERLDYEVHKIISFINKIEQDVEYKKNENRI